MKFYITVILMMMGATLSGFAQKERQLVILHTNDMHSTIWPLSEELPDTMKAGRAGALRLISMVKEEREKHPDLLLFDSGDFVQGSVYYTMFKGDVEVGLMNFMGYDAATIGNHEFDFGLEEMLHGYTHGGDCETLYYTKAQWCENRGVRPFSKVGGNGCQL